VSAKSVALIARCAERGKVWLPADSEGWQAYLTDDEPPKAAFFLPGVRGTEFGSD